MIGMDRETDAGHWSIEPIAGVVMCGQKRLDGGAEFRLADAGRIEKSGSLGNGNGKDFVE